MYMVDSIDFLTLFLKSHAFRFFMHLIKLIVEFLLSLKEQVNLTIVGLHLNKHFIK